MHSETFVGINAHDEMVEFCEENAIIPEAIFVRNLPHTENHMAIVYWRDGHE